MDPRLEQLAATMTQVRSEVARVIIGQESVIEQALVVVLINQHALFEGVPGIAKTLLVRTLACTLGCEFNRVQFTPDLMPADITGTNVFDLNAREFTLVRGPVFTAFLLADEINRAPAKTQSALLQAMQERTVTIDRVTHALSPNFTVFATQNPVEYEGTYPLPEAQKDRFALRIIVDYPPRADERLLLQRTLSPAASPEATLVSGAVRPVFTAEQLAAARSVLPALTLREELLDYVVEVIARTRRHEAILVGASPRAAQSLLLATRAAAAVRGRDFVTPDDIRDFAVPALAHRLVLRPEFEIEGLTTAEVVKRILTEVPVPR